MLSWTAFGQHMIHTLKILNDSKIHQKRYLHRPKSNFEFDSSLQLANHIEVKNHYLTDVWEALSSSEHFCIWTVRRDFRKMSWSLPFFFIDWTKTSIVSDYAFLKQINSETIYHTHKCIPRTIFRKICWTEPKFFFSICFIRKVMCLNLKKFIFTSVRYTLLISMTYSKEKKIFNTHSRCLLSKTWFNKKNGASHCLQCMLKFHTDNTIDSWRPVHRP